MSVENLPYHINTFNAGANTSDETELVGSKAGSGEHLGGRNQRSAASSDGNSGASEKIKGENLFYQRNVPGAYKCTGAITVNGDIVEFWASSNPLTEFPFVRVNGVVTLLSVDFPIEIGFPLQLDRNENELGGEVFLTDNHTQLTKVGTPMILNVKDMVDALTLNPNKYFSGFNPELYSVNLFIPLDIPVFLETVNVGGGGGLPPGSYAYQLRYSNNDGDRTNISQRTPLIPIVEAISSKSLQYPGVKTYGQDSNPDFGTRYGIKIRFRVTNLAGYDFIEIIRTSYNTNGGINFVPSPIIVAKIDIFDGEISVRDFTDPVESNTKLILTDETTTKEITYINSAKAIRYFDRRLVLMNIELASKESALEFTELNGKQMFPVIEPLGTIGFNDPYNFVYKKADMHGERVGYGVQLYDGVGGRGFTTKVPQGINYQMPNRRDTTSTETNLYSYIVSNPSDGTHIACVKTLNIENVISYTHEVFEHYQCIAKSDLCSFKNIYHNKKIDFIEGIKLVSTVKQDCDETDGEIESHGAKVSAGLSVSPFYNVFTPVRQNDTDVDGHNYVVNTMICKNFSLLVVVPGVQPVDRTDYRPQIFGPNYYSQGMALTGVSNFPAWAKSFSVVRTPPAQRVIAQGIGVYKLIPADYAPFGTAVHLAEKDTDRFWFFSPDIENGIVNGKLIDDIIASPESYQLQFVSPLGFASEVYSVDVNNIPYDFGRDRSVDIIAYARMMRDKTGVWNINPDENSDMGIDGGDGYRYVGYERFRNESGAKPHIFSNGDMGNNLIDIIDVKRVSEGRGTYMMIQIDRTKYGDLYWNAGTNGNSNFEDEGMRNFTEPFYMVNIVANGENVRDQNIENYRITSHYQKLESIIGQGNGLLNQKFPLVDERWEDCISAPFQAHSTSSTPRYLYIKNPTTNVIKKWVNVTFLSSIDRNIIALAISSSGSYTGVFGTGVQGMYTHENVNNRLWTIVFNVSGYYPLQNELVLVRYDNTAPIRFWGGDTVVGESIFAPIDREASANSLANVPVIGDVVAAENQFPFGIGFPYRLWKMNPRYYQVKRTKGTNIIQDRNWGYLGYIRQMCIMFTVESRIATPYAHNNDYPLQFFPNTNYVIRPLRWDDDLSLSDNNIAPQYAEDYGEVEKSYWKYGGFRFRQNINPDYSNVPPKEFVSRPKFGFKDKTKFYTRIMWSLPRQINQQNTPGLKTFPANNSFDIDDWGGEIKRAWAATSDKGWNLYAIVDSGICLLLTKKSILSDLNAGQLGYMAADTFIKEQYWIEGEVGMSDELWRTAVEEFVNQTMADGTEIRNEALFFLNDDSAFRVVSNEVKDIGRANYHNTLFKKLIQEIKPGYESNICAVYDKLHEEYYVHVDNDRGISRTEVFSQKKTSWNGYYDYKFDVMVNNVNQTFGFRNGETYELGVGNIINGNNVTYEITTVAAPKQFNDKEYTRVKINTGEEVKPTSVQFYDKLDGAVMCSLDISKGPLYLKKYRGWEQGIPRKDFSYSATRDRVQGRSLVYNITYNGDSDFRVIDSGIMYKQIVS